MCFWAQYSASFLMRNHFCIPCIIKFSPFASVLSNKTSVTLQLWICHLPPIQAFFFFFSYIKNLRKAFLEYWQNSRSYLPRGLQDRLGKVSSLLNNFRNCKHLSKNREQHLLTGLMCNYVRLKGRSLHAYATKSKAASNEMMSERRKICYFEA